MEQSTIFLVFLAYTLLLFLFTWFTSRKANNETFFVGNRVSPWYVVAYGMIGASLSGVTFMSVPGWVRDTQFSYMMVVFGYLVGYFVIATVLMPLYYRLNLTSIYGYLEQRFGNSTYKTGSAFFLLSRTIGASLRMFLVINVLHLFVFQAWNIPFWLTATVFILIILLYTIRGGIRTIVWTDTLQTTFMLAAVGISIWIIARELNLSLGSLLLQVKESEISNMWVTNWQDKRYFLKQFVSGAFIAIVMTGLDQDMMQKNLSCKNLADAQKNMYSFSLILVVVNLVFLILGAVLLMFANSRGLEIPVMTDELFPGIALKHLGALAGIVFLIGVISAAYSSADGALTALTTAFCVDFLGMKKDTRHNEMQKIRTRYTVHLMFALVFIGCILFFRELNDKAVIDKIFTIAGYTYGPLLGFYSFGLFTSYKVNDKWVPLVAIASPVICYFINRYSESLLWGYQFGFELLILNGLLTFVGLLALRRA